MARLTPESHGSLPSLLNLRRAGAGLPPSLALYLTFTAAACRERAFAQRGVPLLVAREQHHGSPTASCKQQHGSLLCPQHVHDRAYQSLRSRFARSLSGDLWSSQSRPASRNWLSGPCRVGSNHGNR
ncbi:hypothetical protein BDU57DRAFT_308431 [Ampelomyces quisqualis]|uniref:Uncharacterized protein n=1 Tax=Ampelomyces quisqualis TaxID=50730 RepID=A0A6A5QHW0_AMPQU|nr:hypothetical protein BDU57DRAFT_308431 [Ampelomyces quisqualis]